METIDRHKKERLLNQKGKVIWLTGLSGAGKTTIALALEKMLYEKCFLTKLLDGDILREGLNSNLGFSPDDRNENIRRVAEVSKLFVNSGFICINSFISPTEESRNIARNIIGEHDFIEVYVNAPLDICEERDVKGLYKKARLGEIKQFTGISASYVPPSKPNIIIQSYNQSAESSAKELYNYIIPQISYNIKADSLSNIEI